MSIFHRFRKNISLLLAVSALLALSYACGDDDGGGRGPAPTSPGDGGGNGGGAAETLAISMPDNFFAPAQFVLGGGTTIKFNITNNSMAIHNMHVAGADSEYDT